MKTYIEAGANDGLFQSRTLNFKDNPEWRGILIEADETEYNSCIHHRSNERTNIIHAALVSREYKQEYRSHKNYN